MSTQFLINDPKLCRHRLFDILDNYWYYQEDATMDLRIETCRLLMFIVC